MSTSKFFLQHTVYLSGQSAGDTVTEKLTQVTYTPCAKGKVMVTVKW